MTIRSPFIIKHDFISPQLCESISAKYNTPEAEDDELSSIIFDKLQEINDDIIATYEIDVVELENPIIYTLPQQTDTKPICENSKHLRKKWVQVYFRDITGIIFLSTTNMHPPFDADYEVYGGKLEFPQHGFGFNSNRGVMIMYPSGPHFINKFTPPEAGNLQYIKFHLKSSERFMYQPNQYPGDYTSWFINDL